MKLSEIVTAYVSNTPAGIVLDEPDVQRLLRNAVRFYCGYATLRNHPPQSDDDRDAVPVIHTAIDETPSTDDDQDFDLTVSEWAIISPLFSLYIERENAQHLEASRNMGLDVYGRLVSEIAQDIRQMEEEVCRKAFIELPVTV